MVTLAGMAAFAVLTPLLSSVGLVHAADFGAFQLTPTITLAGVAGSAAAFAVGGG